MGKKKVGKIILIGIGVIIAIGVIGAIGGGSGNSETSSSSETTVNSNNQTSSQANFIKAGMYKVGSEIAAGEYVIECTGNPGYFQITSDSSGEFDSIIVNDNLSRGEFGYVIVQNDDYIQLQNCRMYASSDKTIQPKDLNKIPSSTYKIGKDLPAGEYKLTVKSQPAYWERSRNPRDSIFGIIANDNIENSAYVRVSDGEYFKLIGVEATLVQ